MAIPKSKESLIQLLSSCTDFKNVFTLMELVMKINPNANANGSHLFPSFIIQAISERYSHMY